jgi:hypothetical protein
MNQFFFLSTPLIVSVVVAFVAMVIALLVEYTGVVLNRKRFLIALALTSLSGGVWGLFGMSHMVNEGYWYYFLIQVFFIGIGIWLAILLRKNYFSDAPKEKYVNYVLMLAFVCFTYSAFSLVFNYFAHSDLGYHYGTAVFSSMIPILFIQAMESFSNIPAPIFKVWYIDESRDEPDFEDVNIRNIMLTSLDIVKNVNDDDFTNIKIKAPLNMKFSDWFQSFVLSYNEKYPESDIQYKYLDGTYMGWIFYIKAGFFGKRKYIEPNKTFQKNGITEKQTIVAERARLNF